MARQFTTLTKTAITDANNRTEFQPGKGAAPVTTVTTTTVASDLATLVADGASPTQAHVTALNTAYTTMAAQITALSAETGDVYFSFDTTKITTLEQIQSALAKIEKWARSAGFQ